MYPEYLNLSRAEDLKDKKERVLYRCLEILPGFLSLLTLTAAFLLSWVAPVVVAFFIIAFDVYWLMRVAYLSFHQVASYRSVRKNLKTNWLEELDKLDKSERFPKISWKDIYHLIILPMYKEGQDIIRPTLKSLADSEYPKDKLIVVLATEERAGEEARLSAKEMEREFTGKFFCFLITIHPQNIEGEIAGKGSNVAWAAKIAKEKIISPQNIPVENVIVSNFDIDTRPYPQYFSCLAWNYLKAKNPLKSTYQPVPIYNNNIWQAPAFSRVIATSGTFWQIMQQERPEQLVTYSSHSLPFKIFEEVGYPQNVVSDDSRIFWKSYLFYDGVFQAVPLHYPVSMDAVMAKNLKRTAVNQYKQQRRWAWGCIEIPYIIYGFLKNKKIPLGEKFRHTYNILDGFWSWAVSALLIFFLGWLPLILGGEKFDLTLLSTNLPRITSALMNIAMFGMLISAALSMLLLPPRPKSFSKWKNLFMVFQWVLLPFTLIIFGSIPALDAQIRLIFNKPLGFWVTEKVGGKSF